MDRNRANARFRAYGLQEKRCGKRVKMKPGREKLLKEKIREARDVLRGGIYTRLFALTMEYAVTAEPVSFEKRTSLPFIPLKEGDVWSSQVWDCGWFHITGNLPNDLSDNIYLALDFEGEGCLFNSEGVPLRGITNRSSEFDRSLGMPGKRYVPLREVIKKGGNRLDVWIETGNNDLFGNFCSGVVRECAVVACNEERRNLFYDYSFLMSFIESVPDGDPLHYTIVYDLEKVAMNVAREMTDETVRKCREILRPHLERKNISDPLLTFTAVGHSHLDLAWLWPLRETRRKAGRTFATALANLTLYPKYVYGASQPQQFAWVKEDYPALFEQIKKAVREGRFELQGGMWVEADSNTSGGESLVRQFLYGKKFWKEEFGKEIDTLWLPDAFGFSGALPQIMLGCGCRNFLTIKLSWNMVNDFPYHSFRWRGIDGSEVLAHLPPEGTYNSSATPKALREAAANYAERGLSKNAMMLYGIGDGGGGPGREHLEYISREGSVYGIPDVKSGTSEAFFKALREEQEKLPVYKGELYLERHQGTFTSQSDNKYYNRRMENALADLEFLQALTGGKKSERLEEIWKEVLLYQFHDILPGSSIRRVYNECVARYKLLFDEVTASISERMKSTGSDLCVYNATSYCRNEFVKAEGIWYRVSAQPYSIAKLRPVEEAYHVSSYGNRFGNDLLEVTLGERGEILSVREKRTGREALARPSATFPIYNDVGNAWDFYCGYVNTEAEHFDLIEREYFTDGAQAGVKQTYRYGKSTLEQLLYVMEGSPIVRADIRVNWQETEKMLRVDFYPAVSADHATCDIQFGNVQRSMLQNSSVESAQYEVVAHKWVDMSEDDHGVAILNNGKYGYRLKDGCISMDLLRSQMHPCFDQDKGEHEFSFAIYPHKGNVHRSDVAAQAYAFNRPFAAIPGKETPSLVRTTNAHAVIETVKPAEDGKGYIVRLYNDLPHPVTAELVCKGKKTVTDMLEHNLKPLDGEFTLRGYEILTVRVEQDRK